MDPELVREVLQIINEVSQPVYAAAYQKVIITNAVWGLAFLPLLGSMTWLTIHSWAETHRDNYRDSEWWELGVIFGVIGIVVCFVSIISCVINLLTIDYLTYQAIGTLVLPE